MKKYLVNIMKKIFAILLCFSTLFFICACTTGNDTSDTQSVYESAPETSNETSVEESTNGEVTYSAEIPDDFSWDGEFIILSTSSDPSTVKYPEFGCSDIELESSVVNDAVATRNGIVEEKLGIKIIERISRSPDRFDTGEFVREVEQAINGGTADFSMIAPSLYHAGALAKKGQLYNLNKIDNMSLESPWWDQYFIDAANVMNKLYFVTGDIGFIAKDTISAVFFNKEIVKSLELEDPYQLVKNMKWTIDKIHSWAKLYNTDTNDDDVINHLDIFGIGGQNDNIKTFFFSAGEQFAKLDENNIPVLTAYNTRSSNVIDRFQEFITDKSCFVNANNLWDFSNTPVNLLVDAFSESRALLFWDSLSNIEGMRKMDVDFGILPLPIYEETQDRYHSMLNPYGGNAFAIAGNVDENELEDIATIMNVLGAEGKNFVTPAYIEKTLKGQRLRDDESEEMLDIIFNNIGADIGFIYCFGRPAAEMLGNVAKGQSFTTLYDSHKGSFERNIADLIETFSQLD